MNVFYKKFSRKSMRKADGYSGEVCYNMDSKYLRPPLLFPNGTWCCNKPKCPKLNNYQDKICECGTLYDECDFTNALDLIFDMRYKKLWKQGYIY